MFVCGRRVHTAAELLPQLAPVARVNEERVCSLASRTPAGVFLCLPTSRTVTKLMRVARIGCARSERGGLRHVWTEDRGTYRGACGGKTGERSRPPSEVRSIMEAPAIVDRPASALRAGEWGPDRPAHAGLGAHGPSACFAKAAAKAYCRSHERVPWRTVGRRPVPRRALPWPGLRRASCITRRSSYRCRWSLDQRIGYCRHWGVPLPRLSWPMGTCLAPVVAVSGRLSAGRSGYPRRSQMSPYRPPWAGLRAQRLCDGPPWNMLARMG
ncbi:uncharacterized protein C8Q71DRAFT_245789 [Rhodofomes roseus]|uniref:Uncharacterized protein n=1 Tax=Rhodofomes roseus TaxID=34475 RepID=A0ABQ8K7C8_9APHY|nr:uncharacterized protein C8Q71DRAFT_245789 [Rhodofomes roseus]KAH9832954.1 hypothetical protein C8Q71DRAFT_245789 [Rhodofomes roseus]